MTREEIDKQTNGMFETYDDKRCAIDLAIEISNAQIDRAIEIVIEFGEGAAITTATAKRILESLKIN